MNHYFCPVTANPNGYAGIPVRKGGEDVNNDTESTIRMSTSNTKLAVVSSTELDERKQVSKTDQIGLVITAWNLWREGKSVTKFQIGEWGAKNFPKPI